LAGRPSENGETPKLASPRSAIVFYEEFGSIRRDVERYKSSGSRPNPNRLAARDGNLRDAVGTVAMGHGVPPAKVKARSVGTYQSLRLAVVGDLDVI
jgi:hypothetical protein